MLQFLAHDTVNDVAIIKTTLGYNVRYGLQVALHASLTDALTDYASCVRHALECQGLPV